MTLDELVAQLCNAIGTVNFDATLETLTPHLSTELIHRFARHIDSVVAYDPHRALELAEAGVLIAKVVDDPKALMYSRWIYGWSLFSLRRMEDALSVYDKVVSYLVSVEDWSRLAAVRNNQLSILNRLDRYEEVFQAESGVREILAKAGPSAEQHHIRLDLQLAQCKFNVGRFQESYVYAERGAKLAEKHNDKLAAIAFKMIIGNLHYEFNEYELAGDALGEALKLAIESEQRTEVARLHSHLGKLNQRKGLYQTALASFETAHSIFSELQIDSEVTHVNYSRAAVYLQLNLLQEAIELSASASDLTENYVAYWPIAVSLLDQVQALMRASEFEQAERVLMETRSLLQEIGAEHMLALANLEYARLKFMDEDFEASNRLGVSVLEHAKRNQHSTLNAKAELFLARCDLADMNVDSAETRLIQARQLAKQHDLNEIAIQVHHLAGSINQTRNPQAAYSEFEQAISKIAIQNANLLLDEFRIGYLSDKTSIYDAWIDASHERVNAGALPVRHLLYALDEAQTAPLHHSADNIDNPLTVDEQERLFTLRTEWNWYQTQLDRVSPNVLPLEQEKIDAISHDTLRDIEHEIAELVRRQRIRSGGRVDSNNAVQGDNAAELIANVTERLEADEALVVYYIAHGHCHALLVKKEGIEVLVDLVEEEKISALLGTWRFHIQSVVPMQPDPLPQLAQLYLGRLYEGLFRQISSKLTGIDTLNIIMPTSWHDLPIAALYDGKHYLIERYTLTHLSAPQAMMRRVSSPSTDTNGEMALVIGYSDEGRLPKTLQESFTIRDALPARWSIKLLTEETATESCFRQYCHQATLIHLATHATFRPDNPLFSWLRFADKHVTVTDLYDMKLTARPLVVLSACETGQGKPQGGGVLGMGRGLLAAGASQVVLSRWQLEDVASAELMQHFYSKLDPQQTNVPQALREAQLATFADYPHPFFWASYMYTPG